MAFEDVVQLNFYVTSRNDYSTARKEFGRVWRKHCGKHYPGMAMFQVVSLFDPDASDRSAGDRRAMIRRRFDCDLHSGCLRRARAVHPWIPQFDYSAGLVTVELHGDGFVKVEDRRIPLEALGARAAPGDA